MEEKRNFFKKVWTSVKDFEKYEEFAAEKASKALIYLCLLTVVFTGIIVSAYTYKFYSIVQEAKTYIEENVKEIKYEMRKIRYSIRKRYAYNN